jgi:hypothetical protein
MGLRQTTLAAPPAVIATASSEDECIQKLALLIEHRDSKKLHEIVALIARLTSPVPFAAN